MTQDKVPPITKFQLHLIDYMFSSWSLMIMLLKSVRSSYHSASPTIELIQSSCIIHSSGSGAVIRSTYSISTTSSWNTQRDTDVTHPSTIMIYALRESQASWYQYKCNEKIPWRLSVQVSNISSQDCLVRFVVIPLICLHCPCEWTVAFAGTGPWLGSRSQLCCEMLQEKGGLEGKM